MQNLDFVFLSSGMTIPDGPVFGRKAVLCTKFSRSRCASIPNCPRLSITKKLVTTVTAAPQKIFHGKR